MAEKTVEELLEEYPYLKDFKDRMIFVTEKEHNELSSSEKIYIGKDAVIIEVLKRILKDDFYFEHARRYFNNDTNEFRISYIYYGDTAGSISYKKSTIVKGLKELVSTGQIELSIEEKERLDILERKIDFNSFLEKHNGNKYNIEIDGVKCSFPIEELVEIMQMPSARFDEICSNDSIKEINGYKKEVIIYAAFKFFRENKVFEEYIMPINIAQRYREIGTLQKIDLQSINKYLTTTDKKYQDVEIDEELEKAILEGMPEDATDLEKAIFIYIKMCKLLTYDEEYFTVNQKGEATEKHKRVEYVSTITLQNNKVVCFEFNMMYAKLLSKLGIHFASSYGKNAFGMENPFGEDDYGKGHANLEFRAGKFLVSADSVTSILQGDIMQAKLNQKLVGIKCNNRNKKTQQEFQAALTKMYRLIAQQEKGREEVQVEKIETLDELLAEYSQETENIRDVSINERLSILINKVNSTGMVGIDSLSYVLQLRKILFTEEQRKNNIGVTIVRNNEPIEDGKIAKASAIFTLNPNSFEDTPEQTVYFYYNPNQELVLITREELQVRFDEGTFSYIEEKDPRIPGLTESGGIKK